MKKDHFIHFWMTGSIFFRKITYKLIKIYKISQNWGITSVYVTILSKVPFLKENKMAGLIRSLIKQIV
jgi:hypothetical protein